MMPDSGDSNDCARAEFHLQAAIDAIERISSELPSSNAAGCLAEILRRTSKLLTDNLNAITDDARTEERASRQYLLIQLCECACRIARAMNGVADGTLRDLAIVLHNCWEWPAVVAVDPAYDIRKAVRGRESPARKFYGSALEAVGANSWVRQDGLRESSIFREIAFESASMISMQTETAHCYREAGLPWLLDAGDFKLNESVPKATMDWLVALKYFLHLTLAPEPDRSGHRALWRTIRDRVARNAHLSIGQDTEFATRFPLHEIEFPWTGFGPRLRSKLYRSPFARPHLQPSKIIERWWTETLLYKPTLLFGDMVPLNQWDDPKIQTLVNAPMVKSRPKAAFGRCVDRILDCFLRLCGAKGIKDLVRNVPTIAQIEFSADRAS